MNGASITSLIKGLLDGVLSGKVLEIVSLILAIFVLYFTSKLIIKLVEKLVEKFVKRKQSKENTNDINSSRRLHTVAILMKSIIKYVIYFIVTIIILGELGVNTTGIIASAGILGLAIGFGAQSLAKDMISGFFIIFEDQYAVGDYVTIGSKSGIVEELALRITKIRDFEGQIYIIPNGQVDVVTNYRSKELRILFDVQVSYETDLDKAISAIQDAFDENLNLFPKIIQKPRVMGVSNLGESGISIRIFATAVAMEHWQTERDMKLFVKKVLDKHKIEMPLPHRVIINKDK